MALFPAAAWAAGFSVGWYPTSYFNSQGYTPEACDPVARVHQEALPNNLLYGSCDIYYGTGDQSTGYILNGYPYTIAVSGSSGYVSASGLTITRAFSTVVTRNVPTTSNAQTYAGAVWSSPGACSDRTQFRLVYNSVANYSTGEIIQC